MYFLQFHQIDIVAWFNTSIKYGRIICIDIVLVVETNNAINKTLYCIFFSFQKVQVMTQVVVISYSSPFNLFIARTNLTKIGMWYDSNWKLFFLEFSCHELSYNRKLLTFVVTKSYEEPILFVTLEYFWYVGEPVKSNLARAVLAPWLFAILIVTSSFTASLSSMMTVSHLEPSVPDIQTLLRTNAIIGCNKNTFLVHYLVDELKFNPEIWLHPWFPKSLWEQRNCGFFYHCPSCWCLLSYLLQELHQSSTYLEAWWIRLCEFLFSFPYKCQPAC